MLQLELSAQEFKQLRDYIEVQWGIAIGEEKAYLVQSRLTNLVVETSCRSFGDFYEHIITKGSAALRDKIVDAITTNETLWFRDSSPWLLVRDKLLPSLDQAAYENPGKSLRLWSAACSTGQEPYSIAMVIDDYCRRNRTKALSPDKVEIIATDISPSALYIAMNARYDRVSMSRGLLGEFASFRQTYFTQEGRFSLLSTDIRKRVQFKRINLLDSFDGLGRFDVVFLRNVAIYFSDEVKRQLYEKISRALLPGGGMILGSTETVTDLSRRFQPTGHGRAVMYALV